MLTRTKNSLVLWLVLGVVLVPAFSKGDSSYRPTRDGGNFGIGLEVGEPGNWGITGKVWIDHENAFQGAVKLPSGEAILQLDYLWHDFDLIHMKDTDGEWPFYVGVGGDLGLNDPVVLGARVPVGMSYIFDKKNVPVDIYLQLVPVLWLTDRTDFRIYGELGAHYYF
ncbi:MAG TPA: hypothetical protein VHE12_10645 [bacterium]|nr:hypothetical protein [bacterium]